MDKDVQHSTVYKGKKKKRHDLKSQQEEIENSLAVQWLGFGTFTARGSIPDQGTKIPTPPHPTGPTHTRTKDKYMKK